MKRRSIRVALGEADFLLLVSGKEVATVAGDQRVEIILSDIGFDRMLAAINDAVRIRGLGRVDPR